MKGSLLYYASLGLIDEKVKIKAIKEILNSEIEVMAEDACFKATDDINKLWPKFLKIFNSNAFKRSVELLYILLKRKRPDSSTIDLECKKMKDLNRKIKWVDKVDIRGLTTLKGEIYLGYLDYLASYRGFSNTVARDLIYTVTHEIGHLLIANILSEEIDTPDFGEYYQMLDRKKVVLTETEDLLLSKLSRLDGGYAFQALLFGAPDIIVYEPLRKEWEKNAEEDLFSKMINLENYNNIPLYQESALEGIPKIEDINTRCSDILYMPRRVSWLR